MRLTFNEWTFSGEVFYLKELKGEFAVSLQIRGIANREGVFSSSIMEFGCLMQEKVYAEAKKKGLGMYSNIALSGHLETWTKNSPSGPRKKIMFVADYVIEVESKKHRGNAE